jgi:UDP-N-acetylmuramoyl-tripeptide--D-alanyl-D-alanine ligase
MILQTYNSPLSILNSPLTFRRYFVQLLTCGDILRATGGVLICGNPEEQIANISTDSRKISEGDVFVPICGERFDGHDYINASLAAGAVAALTHKDWEPVPGKSIIRVQDTLKALGDIAGHYRSGFNIPVVGITGSVGKTSTKDMVSGVLGQKFNVLKTAGNFNNEIGLPLTLFNLDAFHQAAVLEMGMSSFGEISRLTAIARPDIAIITNIGMSHIEKLGSRQNILKAKLEILEGLHPGGLVILNGDDPLLWGVRGLLSFRTLFYGLEEGKDYRACNVVSAGESGSHFDISIGSREYKVHVPVPGLHNVYNALAAVAAGIELGLPMDKIIAGIGEFSPGKMRLNIINQAGYKIINDAYNASPHSMEAALSVLKDVAINGRTLAVLGDMLELGDFAEKAHRDVGHYAVAKGIDYVVVVGQLGSFIAAGAREAGMAEGHALSFESNQQVIEFLKSFAAQGDVILVKGSRGMKMEEIVEKLSNDK